MTRAPCCDKEKVTKGKWSAEEDTILRSYVERNGPVTNWRALPANIGLNRCGKSCRMRWINYLRPHIKHGGFSEQEERVISNLYFTHGPKWSLMAKKLRGRTDNDIKNYWHTKLQKKLTGKEKQHHWRRRSNKGVSEAHELYDNIDFMNPIESSPNSTPFTNNIDFMNPIESSPNCTPFTITNSHLMSPNWTHRPTPQIHLAPIPTITVGWPLFSMIPFSGTCANCNHHLQQQQQQQQQNQQQLGNFQGHPIANNIGSSSSMQQTNMNNEENLSTILREVDAALLVNDSPSHQMDATDLVPIVNDVNQIVDNDTIDVQNNDPSYGESMGSLEWNDIVSLFVDEVDCNIDWEGIGLPAAVIDEY